MEKKYCAYCKGHTKHLKVIVGFGKNVSILYQMVIRVLIVMIVMIVSSNI